MSSNDDKLLTKEEHLANYIKTFVAIEDAMEPFKEQKRELREEFREMGWLNTDELRAAVKAYRLFKGNVDIEEVYDNFKILTGADDARS